MSPEPNNHNTQLSYENEGMSYQEIIYILRKYQHMIVVIAGVVLIITLFYTLLQKPVYESTGLIMIDAADQAMNVFDMSPMGGKNYLSNEIEILSSRTTAERTIETLLNSEYRNNLFLFKTRKYEQHNVAPR